MPNGKPRTNAQRRARHKKRFGNTNIPKRRVKIEGNMPAAFLKCVRTGGRVRTKKLKGGKYIHICFKGGKSYSGEVKKKKK